MASAALDRLLSNVLIVSAAPEPGSELSGQSGGPANRVEGPQLLLDGQPPQQGGLVLEEGTLHDSEYTE